MPTPKYAPSASMNRMLGRADVGRGDGRGLVNRYHEAMSTPASRLDAWQLETLFTQSPSADELEPPVRAAIDLLARAQRPPRLADRSLRAPNARHGSPIVRYVRQNESIVERDTALRERLIQTLRATRESYDGSDDERYVREVLGEGAAPASGDEGPG